MKSFVRLIKQSGYGKNIEGIRAILEGKEDETVKLKEEEIRKVLTEICEGAGLNVVNGVTGTLNPKEVQIIGIGSTARGTNLPGAGDYDFAIKISDYRLVKRINEELKKKISSEE